MKLKKKNKIISNLPFIKNFSNKISIKENYIYLDHKYYPTHGHFFTEMMWQFYYYFKLKKEISDLKVYLRFTDQKFIIGFLNLLEIDYVFISDKLILKNEKKQKIAIDSIVKNSKINILEEIFDYEIDINDDNTDIKSKLFFYKYDEDNSKKNKLNLKLLSKPFNVNDKLNFVIDKVMEKLNKIEIEPHYINDKLYFSRRLDNPQKWYYMENQSEISDMLTKEFNFKEISPISNLSFIEKIKYVNNCKTFVTELSSGLTYAFYCKPETNIIILTSSMEIQKNEPIIKFIQNRFKNVSVVNGYDIIYKNLDFNFYSRHVTGLNSDPHKSNFIGFYFPNDEKVNTLFGDKFKFYENKEICIRSNNKNQLLKVPIYEFIDKELYNYDDTLEDLKYFPNLEILPSNPISQRFMISKKSFDFVIDKCNQNNIEVFPVTYSIWIMNKYIINKQDMYDKNI